MSSQAPIARNGKASEALVQRMGEAAAALLASLAGDQRAKAAFEFDDEVERTRWYYTPNPRRGLPLSEMTRPQQRLAHKLVATGLSRSGYVTASAIMGLESTLDYVENWVRPTPGRDPTYYYVSVFGEPGDKQAWGWRFEGHHISLNYTIAGGHIVAPTPTFFGSNPAEMPLSGTGILRPLAGVEDVARELVHTLTEEQRTAAILATAAPPDIMQSNRPVVIDGATPLPPPLIQDQPMTEAEAERLRRFCEWLGYTPRHEEALRYTTAPKGLPAAAMKPAQRQVLLALIGEYIHRMPDELAEIEATRLETDGIEQVHFVWAGGIERGQAHYYRLHGPRFLVEYDRAQDNANHIHSVWRDPADDFGADLLVRHYAEAHRR